MYTKKVMFAFVLGIFLLVTPPFTTAQDVNAAPKAEAPKPNIPKPMVAYRLDFSINEIEDGKKLNTRHYSMYMTDGEDGTQSLKIGTRVPVQGEQGKFEYIDIGTNINARLKKWETPTGLDVNAEISSFPASNEGTASGTPPLIRQLRIGGDTAIILDKPMIIGSVDDPDSKRSFQLEVIVTKLQ
jgi:hypothetical protein